VAKFVISHRSAGMKPDDRSASRAAMETVAGTLSESLNLRIPARSDSDAAGPPRRLHIDADPVALEGCRARWSPDVMVEPSLPRLPAVAFPDLLEPETIADTQAAVGIGAPLAITVLGEGAPLNGATVALMLASSNGAGPATRLSTTTDAAGHAAFAYDPAQWMPVLVIITPKDGFWSWWDNAPTNGKRIDIPALPKSGPIGWWGGLVGAGAWSPTRGAGIRIGVVDTGVGPHPYLSHVTSLGSMINGVYTSTPQAGLDIAEHGTHVCGIIGARPVEESGDFGGLAAGASVSVIRVFANEGSANQGDIADAIDILAREQHCDLINLSLGGTAPSQIELDAILAAAEQGALCIAASGNTGASALLYPAAYTEVAAVAAVAVVGASPANATPTLCMPAEPAKYAGPLYVASFSNNGAGVTCAAPGAGIISTVPAHGVVAAPYADLSGTSMATPMVSACLASILSHDQTYLSLPRGPERTRRASAVLLSTLQPLALSPLLVGHGLAHGAAS
jgi:subtilisin family serine protease